MKCRKIRYGIVLLLLFHGFDCVVSAAPQTASHFVTLAWIPVTQPAGVTIESWNVYRSAVIGAPYTWLASAPFATLTYSDTSVVAGNQYTYVMTSVDTAGVESVYSASAQATIPAAVPLSVATTALPLATVGADYSGLLTAVGGSAPYSWVGNGVPGLTVSSAGLLSGLPTQYGTFILSITVTDSTGAAAGASIPVIVAPPFPPPNSFPSGLVLYWPLDAADTFGGVAIDRSGNSNAGTILGNPLSVTGLGNQALNFGSSASYITATQYTGVFTTSLTLAAWINTTMTSTSQTIFSKYGSDVPRAGYLFRVNHDGNLTMRIGGSDLSSLPDLVTDATVVADGNWHHVVATISFESQTIQFYVDGQLTSSNAINIVPNGDGGAPLHVGANSFGWWDYFTGSMGKVQLYNRALTDAEVKTAFLLTGGGSN
jgi:hypothetical protein